MAKLQPRRNLRSARVVLFALAFLVLSPLLVSLSRQKQQRRITPLPSKNPDAPRDAEELLGRLAATARRVSGGVNVSTARWHREHPCASRDEIYGMYSSGGRNPKWDAVLREYAHLHRECVQRMGDGTEFFLKRRRIDGCQFVVAGVSAGSGIGNKAVSIVSALLYAVLTQRVLLVPEVTAVPGVFCEPFEGSSWTVDPEQVWAESKKRKDLWNSVESFYSRVDARDTARPEIAPVYAVSTTENWDAQPEPRFFCDTEQAQYARVDWLNFRNNLYFVPKLFAVPSFQPALEDIFPDRAVLSHLLRTALLPRDPVWRRVKQVHAAHLRHSDVRIGVQERYFHGKGDFDLLHNATEDNVVDCLVSQNLLPNPRAPNPNNRAPNPNSTDPLRITTIFIASLYQNMASRLSRDFIRADLGSGDAVALVQLSHEGQQFFGVEVDRQALTEILCLSLSEHLILTPQSTFGALAQGYGGLVPWFVDLRPYTPTPCVRAPSREACFQIPASKRFTCPHDVDVDGQFVTDVVPYLEDCHLVEKPFLPVNGADLGMQLITAIYVDFVTTSFAAESVLVSFVFWFFPIVGITQLYPVLYSTRKE